MSEQHFVLICQHCNFKRVVSSSELSEFREVVTCKTCSGAKKYKCPECGYLIRLAKAPLSTVPDSIKHLERLRLENEERKKEIEREIKSFKNP